VVLLSRDTHDLTEEETYREYGYVSVKDGTRLAWVLWRPRESRRYPVILNYSVYWESGTPFDQVKRFLEAGYAYVGVNVRGSGASAGTFSYFQPVEADDGAEIVQWAAAQGWSTGSVGMIGASYGAHTQLAVAALRPAALKAIVPISVDGCEYADEARPGGLFNAALLADWAFKLQPEAALRGLEARIAGGDSQCGAIGTGLLRNPSYYEVMQHPLYDEWWQARALHTRIDRVRVPTLIIQAWQDEYIRPNGALRLFEKLTDAPKRLILQNGPHRLSMYRFNQTEQMRWLDRWVKGQPNGVEAEPAVTVLWEVTEQDTAGEVAPSWTSSYPTWPPQNIRWTTLYLTVGGDLCFEPPAAGDETRTRSYIYPIGTELVGDERQFALEPAPAGALSYRTPALTSELFLLGSPQLSVFFSCDQVDTDFMFTLKDIDSDGNTLFLQRSVLRASLRALDADLSSPHELVQSFRQVDPLVPNSIYQATLSVSALGHVVRRGHRLELSILSPPSLASPVWGFAPEFPASVNTIYHGRAYPSALKLPVLAAEKAPRPAPAAGALSNQPCRRAKAR